MKENQLIYIAFGNEIYQTEAFFSISSAIARNLETSGFFFDINVYTDNPEFYKNLPVQAHPIKKDWYGEINYHFRLKPAVVYENADDYKKTILIDTDTFFKQSPKFLFDKVKNDNLLCNSMNELSKDSLNTETRAVLNQHDLLKENFIHLNSGVIGISNHSKYILKDTIEIIDTLYPKLPNLYTLEELALALAVSKKDVESVECTDLIHHYWSRKAIFRKKVEHWYVKHKNDPTSKAALNDTLEVSDKIPKPPTATRLSNKLFALTVEKKYRQFIIELLNGAYKYENEFDNAVGTAWIEKSIENLKEKTPSVNEIEISEILNKWYVKLKTKNINIDLDV